MAWPTMNKQTVVRPCRGQVWMANFDPVVGHEQAGMRPAVVISVDRLNHGPSNRVIVVPTTSRDLGIQLHVRIEPPEGGFSVTSFARPEDIRAISPLRLLRQMGDVEEETMQGILLRVSTLLGL
ncbi:MAG: type II toxin-antitoxin system PemK/MazF family toxin [Armatimonadota bacterium]